MPVDMAGFAINVDEILRNKDAVIGQTSNGTSCSRLETCFLEQFTTRETAECIGGKEVCMCVDLILRQITLVSMYGPHLALENINYHTSSKNSALLIIRHPILKIVSNNSAKVVTPICYMWE